MTLHYQSQPYAAPQPEAAGRDRRCLNHPTLLASNTVAAHPTTSQCGHRTLNDGQPVGPAGWPPDNAEPLPQPEPG